MKKSKRTQPPVRGVVAEHLGKVCKAARRSLGLSQAALGDRLNSLGCPLDTNALSLIEAGRRRVDADELVVLAKALEVTVLDLILSTENPNPWMVCIERAADVARSRHVDQEDIDKAANLPFAEVTPAVERQLRQQFPDQADEQVAVWRSLYKEDQELRASWRED
jgi:transcriptional regulator with XRE-family HTH domain